MIYIDWWVALCENHQEHMDHQTWPSMTNTMYLWIGSMYLWIVSMYLWIAYNLHLHLLPQPTATTWLIHTMIQVGMICNISNVYIKNHFMIFESLRIKWLIYHVHLHENHKSPRQRRGHKLHATKHGAIVWLFYMIKKN